MFSYIVKFFVVIFHDYLKFPFNLQFEICPQNVSLHNQSLVKMKKQNKKQTNEKPTATHENVKSINYALKHTISRENTKFLKSIWRILS